MAIRGLMWTGDPGPCPVDDAPHTTCINPSSGVISVPITPPAGALAAARFCRPPVLVQVPAEIVSPPFSTAEYRRPKKGPRR